MGGRSVDRAGVPFAGVDVAVSDNLQNSVDEDVEAVVLGGLFLPEFKAIAAIAARVNLLFARRS